MLFQFITRKFVKRIVPPTSKTNICSVIRKSSTCKEKPSSSENVLFNKQRVKCYSTQKNKNDFFLIVLASTSDLTAAEAQYHSWSYVDYTRPVTRKKVIEKSDYQKLELETFQEVVKHFHDIICSSGILKFEELL